MQTLCNIPISEIRVGDRVKSKQTNREGFIKQIIPIQNACRFEDEELIIRWENGNISRQWKYMYDAVWMM